jgi:AcrR family transcriptional regulator
MAEVESNKQLWIEKGYEHFAFNGPFKFSVNQLSKDSGLSRASFYHHFGEIELFIDELLNVHWSICQAFDQKCAETCQSLVPDIYKLLAEYPIALRFNLQLFRHRHIPKFNIIFIKTFESSSNTFALNLFAEHFSLVLNHSELSSLWLTLCESWYSRLNPDQLSEKELVAHGKDILNSLQTLIEAPFYRNLKRI